MEPFPRPTHRCYKHNLNMDAIAAAVGLGPHILHCVFFKFMIDAEPHLVSKTCADFVGLADACKNKKGKTYIKSIEAGADVSIEGKAKGFTHGFVVRFASLDDRDYYIKEDPNHLGMRCA
ncbi:hypothetical protein BCR37DRAFT_380765 [Protomyces lactucae-debilis]|uniref:Stress-response A/B barrel domain-containing protein n=1 Tax=Protomyces lactucae-debilis TaxID=2754530 RepID=A0A1Y2FAF3_PROLT|nr:uncharacterized protein BCR37DRAFT_380765 [Protomyces lactucae-debilis]ORY80902.1 hypothetical protein BCR37DRAFT_380765 [Protomyces lactucae-debilis]